ncbi:MAG TPA: formyl transferase [Rhizobiaceae bacterium]|nr:formyl transferase [Rhizobiaceae bacterium]
MAERLARSEIVVVTAGGPHPWIIINALRDAFGPVTVIQEESEGRGTLIHRRAKKFGWWNALGQTAMMAWSVLGKRLAKRRIAAIIERNGLQTEPPPCQHIIHVPSVNSIMFRAAVVQLDPKAVLLVGCRMLGAESLAEIKCPILNYHAGITPKYRGMNGGYYALAEGDAENFGGTVHLVDAGVDTGDVIYQARGAPAPDDDFLTYAFRLAAISRDISMQAVRDALDGTLKPVRVDLPSMQWFHPTLWRYVWTGLTKGVW